MGDFFIDCNLHHSHLRHFIVDRTIKRRSMIDVINLIKCVINRRRRLDLRNEKKKKNERQSKIRYFISNNWTSGRQCT